MNLSLNKQELTDYVGHLLDAQFPDGKERDLRAVIERAIERCEYCFSRVALAGYRDRSGAVLNHLHGDQFAVFLYFAANSAWTLGNRDLALELSLLNRARHALLIMPDTQLPDIFVIPHTVGTVIGKARYANYLVVCQNVTVANDLTTHLTVEAGVILFPGAFVVGTGTIGEGSVIAANATLQYQDVPRHSVFNGSSPGADIHPRKRDFLRRFFVPPYPGFQASQP